MKSFAKCRCLIGSGIGNIWLLVLVAVMLAASWLPVVSLADEHTVHWSEDWENGQGLWYASNGVWGVGDPTGGTEAHQGSNCLATNLDGHYPDNNSTRFISPSISLPAAPGDGVLWLRFWHWFSMTTDGDRGFVQVSVDGGDWVTVSRDFSRYSSRWSPHILDLSAYAGEDIRLGFYFSETSVYEAWGWYLDELEILDGNYEWTSPEGFEAENYMIPDYGGWYAENGIWEIGDPTAGPGSAYAGNFCAGTVLDGNYPDNSSSRLVSPLVTLPADPFNGELWLSFMHFFNMTTDGDRGRVDIWTASGWETISENFSSYSGLWSEYIVDLSGYAGQMVRFGFYHLETSVYQSAGWYIDDVAIVEGPKVFNNPSTFEGGTRGWYGNRGVWEVGVPTSGPGSAYSGEMCWGTRLHANYPDNISSALRTPIVQLPVDPGILKLKFWQWYSYGTDGDYGEVWINLEDGSSAVISDRFSSTSAGWSQYVIDLEVYANQRVSFEFRHQETSVYESPGWFIDDVEILGMDQSSPQDIIGVTHTQAPGFPVVTWAYMPFDADIISIYHCNNPEFIPNLGNRIALLVNDENTFTDYDSEGWYHFYQVGLTDILGHENRPVGVTNPYSSVEGGLVPRTTAASLDGNSPNPFNPLTLIAFTVNQPTHVRMEIFDLRGRLVKTLIDRELEVGDHSVKFSAEKQASGVYFCRLTAGDTVLSTKMTLVR